MRAVKDDYDARYNLFNLVYKLFLKSNKAFSKRIRSVWYEHYI
jgi:hypothetical protein